LQWMEYVTDEELWRRHNPRDPVFVTTATSCLE
jgi:hypothetical protein